MFLFQRIVERTQRTQRKRFRSQRRERLRRQRREKHVALKKAIREAKAAGKVSRDLKQQWKEDREKTVKRKVSSNFHC